MHQAARKGTARNRFPHPMVRWVSSLFDDRAWTDTDADLDWLRRLRQVAAEKGCRLVFDTHRKWNESVYRGNHQGKGPTILAGGGGNEKFCCTMILHELGHHVLLSRHHHPADPLEGEKSAWKIAMAIAQEHQLPFVPQIRRQCLYSYRRAAVCQQTKGSKRRQKRRPLPKSWRLGLSRRAGAVGYRLSHESYGKKGKRHAKKFLKRTTSKVERKRRIEQE
jgi:hypothetical protein